MCIWQCSCPYRCEASQGQQLSAPGFSSLFLLSDPPLHLPSVTGHHLAGTEAPQVRTAASSTCPAKLKIPWVRDVGKGPVQQGCVQPFLQHVSSGPPVNSFALPRTRKGTTRSNFLPSISQISNRPTAHEDIKMCIPCILYALPVCYGW